MADYRLEERCREINLEACRIAREAADEYTSKNPQKPRFVAGSIGPTSKTCSISSDTTQPGWHTFNYQTLLDAYAEQAEALVEGGVDAILIETIFDTTNARAAIEAARAGGQESRKASAADAQLHHIGQRRAQHAGARHRQVRGLDDGRRHPFGGRQLLRRHPDSRAPADTPRRNDEEPDKLLPQRGHARRRRALRPDTRNDATGDVGHSRTSLG